MIGVAETRLGRGMRSFGYRSHRIFYLVEGDGLLIVRVLHQSRDVATTFGSVQ